MSSPITPSAAARCAPPPRSARASRCRTGGTARSASAKPGKRQRRERAGQHCPASSSITHSDGSLVAALAHIGIAQAQIAAMATTAVTPSSTHIAAAAHHEPGDGQRRRALRDGARRDGEIADAEHRGDVGRDHGSRTVAMACGREAFAAAGEAHAFGGGRLHADARRYRAPEFRRSARASLRGAGRSWAARR